MSKIDNLPTVGVMHGCTDAHKWARWFVEFKRTQNWSIDDIDEDLMLGWFANAMMTMHDDAYRKMEKANREKLQHFLDNIDDLGVTINPK